MIKNIGLLFIVITGLGLGWTASAALHKRVYALEQLERLIELYSVKIRFSGAAVGAILTELYKSDFGNFKFLSFAEKEFSAEKFRKSIERFALDDGFKREDLAILSEFGSLLGKTDLQGQLTHCEMCLAKARGLRKNAAAERDKKGKFYLSLGTMAGIAFALVLI